MKAYPPDRIRNVVLLSHGGAGKTSLAEALLFHTGAINRLGRVDDGTAAGDFEPEEQRRHISLSLAVLPCETAEGKVNLLDAPGYPDFLGEVKAALRVADSAIVVCAATGVEVGTEQAWGLLEAAGLPRLFFVNKMDRENADFLRTLEQAQQQFGQKCVAVHLPIGAQADFRGLIDLITMQAHLKDGGVGPVPEGLQEVAETLREKLVEAACETDDDLLTKYLEGESLSEEEVRRGLAVGTRSGAIVPVLAGSALQNAGADLLLAAMHAWLPSPPERGSIEAHDPQGNSVALEPSPDGAAAALVFKTSADPFVGKLTYFRVYTGTLHSDSHVWNASRGRQERLGQLYFLRGKAQEPTASVGAGDIGAVAKLAETLTGDTLTARERPLLLPQPSFPSPAFCVAVSPKTKADLDKMSAALARLIEEDPTLEIRREADTKETLLCGLGETHTDVAAERMRRKFGAEMALTTPKVAYKETITRKTQSEYRHRKQTGGHGQYGHVFLELEPVARGDGFRFEDRIAGGVVPKQYIPGVEKGSMECLQEGVVAGFPVVDVKVTLYDGSYHPVDSSDMAFQLAASHATRNGLGQASPVLLEPIYFLGVTVPDAFVGDIMSDLNGRRGRVIGTTPQDGLTLIEAHVPQAELLRYALELRALTQGRGTFTNEFSSYEEVPAAVAQRVIAEAKREAVARA